MDAVVDRPGWTWLVAWSGDDAAGVDALFAHGEVGWLGFGATRPEHRGRGAQGAILAGRIERARELGLLRLVTETGAPREDGPGPSYRNILRAGFREIEVRPNLASPGAAPSGAGGRPTRALVASGAPSCANHGVHARAGRPPLAVLGSLRSPSAGHPARRSRC